MERAFKEQGLPFTFNGVNTGRYLVQCSEEGLRIEYGRELGGILLLKFLLERRVLLFGEIAPLGGTVQGLPN